MKPGLPVWQLGVLLEGVGMQCVARLSAVKHCYQLQCTGNNSQQIRPQSVLSGILVR